MMTPTLRDGVDLGERLTVYHDSFRRLMDTRLGRYNQPKFAMAAKRFSREHYQARQDAGEITEVERIERVMFWDKSIDRFNTRLAKMDKPRFRDVFGEGVAILEVTVDQDWHVHRHVVLDTQFIPWPYLAVLWDRATRGEGKVIDIRPIGKTDRDLQEVFKYLTKSWEIPPEKHKEFKRAVRGKKRVWPLGKAKPAEVDKVCPICNDPGCSAKVMGIGRHAKFYRSPDGKREAVVVLTTVDHRMRQRVFISENHGAWILQQGSVYLILSELECQSSPAPPPSPPP